MCYKWKTHEYNIYNNMHDAIDYRKHKTIACPILKRIIVKVEMQSLWTDQTDR